jgi:hypothetical protein
MAPVGGFGAAFREHPSFMFFATVLAVVSLVLAIMALARARDRKVLPIVAAVLAVCAMGVGFQGTRVVRHVTDQVLDYPGLDAKSRAALQAQGYADAAYHAEYAVGVAAVPLLLSIGAFVLGVRGRTSATK